MPTAGVQGERRDSKKSALDVEAQQAAFSVGAEAKTQLTGDLSLRLVSSRTTPSDRSWIGPGQITSARQVRPLEVS
ncbi:hypothetical protein BBP40_010230, partial [Aspergillus hancockii]